MFRKILVIDDSTTLHNLYEILFRPLNAELLFASNGQDALRTFHANGDIEAVFLDMKMPGMPGIEVLDELRKTVHGDTLPIFIVSAVDEDRPIIDAMRRGADGYITKPFSLKQLLLLMRRYSYKKATRTFVNANRPDRATKKTKRRAIRVEKAKSLPMR